MRALFMTFMSHTSLRFGPSVARFERAVTFVIATFIVLASLCSRAAAQTCNPDDAVVHGTVTVGDQSAPPGNPSVCSDPYVWPETCETTWGAAQTRLPYPGTYP